LLAEETAKAALLILQTGQRLSGCKKSFAHVILSHGAQRRAKHLWAFKDIDSSLSSDAQNEDFSRQGSPASSICLDLLAAARQKT
jgi:hypothetical protein